ncbi:DUF4381 domain-containing protein [Luteibacter jiangsuensis]|uniref:DUF4381 domain-containing protein n=1 Tax=Luteibacter jiangsuensis TaxID=637577 RepID=A0ABX0Q5X1_9GAMM|nr:DUF4381 domain-containing protein [Luteibacter jiangsuensis]NID05072.1 DUF4381 domain-containing protein [Luteibacter jiangsuensis]
MPANGPELRDIHVPHVSMWWPLAPGWWLLLALLLAAAIALTVFLRRRAAWRRFVDASLADLRTATARHAEDGDTLAFAATASQLVRRVARFRDPRSATLSGAAWRQALAAIAPDRDVSRLAALDEAKYRPVADIDVRETAAAVEAWVRKALARRRSHVAA